MEELNERISEIRSEIQLMQDPQYTSTLTEEGIRDNHDQLSLMISEFNSFILAQREIDPTFALAEQKEIEILANSAFQFLSDLLTKQMAKSKPTIETATTSAVDEHFRPNPRPRPTTLPIIMEQPVDSSIASTSGNFAEVTNQLNESALNKNEFVQSVLNHITNEFSRLYNAKQSKNDEPILGAARDDDPILQNRSTDRARSEEIEQISIQKAGSDHPILQLKFDKVQLPTFNGNLTEWIPFRDQFLDLVHLNKNLSEVTKFYQLRNHLTGLALETINGFKMCSTDYDAAWRTVLARFDNQDQIIFEYIKKFFELPILGPNPGRSKFFAMVDRTNQLLRVLPRFGINVLTWDYILMYCLVSRLDSHTLKKWQDQVKKRQGVKINELLDFLEVEAQELASVTNVRPQIKPKVKGPKAKPNVMLVTKNLGCAGCNEEHPTFNCPTFLALSIKARIKKVRENKLCLKCLRKAHKECSFRNCKICNQPHNDLLCYKSEMTDNGERAKKSDSSSQTN